LPIRTNVIPTHACFIVLKRTGVFPQPPMDQGGNWISHPGNGQRYRHIEDFSLDPNLIVHGQDPFDLISDILSPDFYLKWGIRSI
jgi:hypothetical protein